MKKNKRQLPIKNIGHGASSANLKMIRINKNYSGLKMM
jgi:hypothetical protein